MFGSKQRKIDKELDALMKIVPSAYAIIEKTLVLKKEDAQVRAWAFAATITVNGCGSKLTDPNATGQSCIYSTFEHVRANKSTFLDSDKTDQELYDYFYDFTNMLLERWDEFLKHAGIGPDSKIDYLRTFNLQQEFCYLVEDGENFARDDDRDLDYEKKSQELVTLVSEASTYFTKLTR